MHLNLFIGITDTLYDFKDTNVFQSFQIHYSFGSQLFFFYTFSRNMEKNNLDLKYNKKRLTGYNL